MGLNVDPNRESNVHANVFLPSCQMWAFDWASKVCIVALHGNKTVQRASMSMFDQAVNECASFEKNLRNALLRFCWCHRGVQKTKPIRKKKDSLATRLVLNSFDALCDYISNGVENEKEHVMLMHCMRQHVDTQHRRGFLSNGQLDELNSQLSKINSNKSNVTNQYFMNCKHMITRTTTANECRHRN